MAQDLNHVALIGRLTRDPELKTFQGAGAVCALRLAVNGRRKNTETGQWDEQPNFFDVAVWGPQGENAAKYLAKGRQVAISGRLRWREFQRQDGGKRQAVDVVAESVQFLGGSGESANLSRQQRRAEPDVPIDTGDFEAADATGGTSEDDIPF
jgi:single-strand DNA-binding protein